MTHCEIDNIWPIAILTRSNCLQSLDEFGFFRAGGRKSLLLQLLTGNWWKEAETTFTQQFIIIHFTAFPISNISEMCHTYFYFFFRDITVERTYVLFFTTYYLINNFLQWVSFFKCATIKILKKILRKDKGINYPFLVTSDIRQIAILDSFLNRRCLPARHKFRSINFTFQNVNLTFLLQIATIVTKW